ncbi:MAG: hypothetical protein HC918_12305, partial [Oscillatoriales cyanobacterium SM2_1_8]|nr:hypothetical protein [Oscillatoriales cyanobacterium SM2_1_8]
MADSQASASTDLLQQINGLLSRPLGDRATDRTYVAQREQLKQWRSQLATATDPETVARLTQSCRQLLPQMDPSFAAVTPAEPTLSRSLRAEIAEALAQERGTLLAEVQRVLGDRLEVQALTQRKEALQAEIDRLEAERQDRLEEFKRQQRLQQEALTETLTRWQQAAPVPSPEVNPALVVQVQEQTDRFLLALDVMFANTFRSLEDEMQGYRYSVTRKLEQMRDLEQTGEALLGALVDRLGRQVRALPPEAEDELAQVLNQDWSPERLDENAIGNLTLDTAAEVTPTIQPLPRPSPIAEPEPAWPVDVLPPEPPPIAPVDPPSAEAIAHLLGEETAAPPPVEMDTAPQLDPAPSFAPEPEPMLAAPVTFETADGEDGEDESLILLPHLPAPTPEPLAPDLVDALQFDLAHPDATAPLPEMLASAIRETPYQRRPAESAAGFAESDLDAALALLDLPTLSADDLTTGEDVAIAATELDADLFGVEVPDNLEAELFGDGEDLESLEAELFLEAEPLAPESMDNLEAELFLEPAPLAPESMDNLEADLFFEPELLEPESM